MDLRQNQITVGELLQNPRARAVFQRRFGKWMKHPMVQAAHSLTLAQLSILHCSLPWNGCRPAT